MFLNFHTTIWNQQKRKLHLFLCVCWCWPWAAGGWSDDRCWKLLCSGERLCLQYYWVTSTGTWLWFARKSFQEKFSEELPVSWPSPAPCLSVPVWCSIGPFLPAHLFWWSGCCQRSTPDSCCMHLRLSILTTQWGQKHHIDTGFREGQVLTLSQKVCCSNRVQQYLIFIEFNLVHEDYLCDVTQCLFSEVFFILSGNWHIQLQLFLPRKCSSIHLSRFI